MMKHDELSKCNNCKFLFRLKRKKQNKTDNDYKFHVLPRKSNCEDSCILLFYKNN
jgi:hypothetical protein